MNILKNEELCACLSEDDYRKLNLLDTGFLEFHFKKMKDIFNLPGMDQWTRTKWTNFMEATGASGVLLGRPALYNTSSFCKPTESSSPPYGYECPLLLDKTSMV
jgi:hypothetical protein